MGDDAGCHSREGHVEVEDRQILVVMSSSSVEEWVLDSTPL